MTTPKKWTIATARQHLPALIAASAREPQKVYRRNKLVAAVVSPEALEAVAVDAKRTLGDWAAELQRICAEENYTLPVAPRHDRPNAFVKVHGGPARKRLRKR